MRKKSVARNIQKFAHAISKKLLGQVFWELSATNFVSSLIIKNGLKDLQYIQNFCFFEICEFFVPKNVRKVLLKKALKNLCLTVYCYVWHQTLFLVSDQYLLFKCHLESKDVNIGLESSGICSASIITFLY